MLDLYILENFGSESNVWGNLRVDAYTLQTTLITSDKYNSARNRIIEEIICGDNNCIY